MSKEIPMDFLQVFVEEQIHQFSLELQYHLDPIHILLQICNLLFELKLIKLI